MVAGGNPWPPPLNGSPVVEKLATSLVGLQNVGLFSQAEFVPAVTQSVV